jgi:S-adenosylmethionine hydrolase
VDRRDTIAFLSDYGLEDEFVGVCRGVILSIAPNARVVDVHHNIMRQDIGHGAVVLEQTAPFLAGCVHLCVVDPTVGSNRRTIALQTSWGDIFIGPDNGLMIPAALAAGGIVHAADITDERFMLTPVSRTFHGRDIFAPVAAHVATGVDIRELGPEIDADELMPYEIPRAWIHDDHIHAEVLQVDRFGNLQFNFGWEMLQKVDLHNQTKVEVRVEGNRLNVPIGDTFADVDQGEYVFVADSYRHLSLAVFQGDAAASLRAGAGSTAIVGPTLR